MIRLILTILCVLLLASPAWGAELTAVKDVPREYVTKLSDADVRVKLTDKPRIEASKWSGEAYLHLTYEAMDVSLTTASLTDKVASAKVGGQTVKTWALGGDVLEMSVTFDRLADVPKAIELTIQDSGNLDYFFQPELTADEIKGGCYRPPNVVGSYAVYHKSKAHNQYKTGKLCHLYRWEAIGADGKRRWLDPLKVEKGRLLIGVPDISGMAFPVTCMGAGDTLGFTGIGGTFIGPGTNGSHFVMPADGTLSGSGKVYIGNDTGGAVDFHHEIAIYEYNAGTPHGATQIDVSDVIVTNVAGWSAQWSTNATGIAGNLTSGASYWLLTACGDAGSRLKYDTSTTQGGSTWINKYGAWATPGNFADWSTENRKYSIYVDYTAGGAPAAPPRRRGSVKIEQGWLDRLRDWLTPRAWAWRTE